MKKCPKCQHENSDQAKFCNSCGSKLSNTCSKCGMDNNWVAKFCSHCGFSLATDEERERSEGSITGKELKKRQNDGNSPSCFVIWSVQLPYQSNSIRKSTDR